MMTRSSYLTIILRGKQMAVKKIVSTAFWTDSKVVDMFSPEDKYFMLYLLTNPHSTQLGIYHLSPKIAGFEMGYSVEAIQALLDRFENNYKLIKWNSITQEIAIKNYLRHSIVKGGKPVADLLKKELAGIKDRALVQYVFDELKKANNLNVTVKDFIISTNLVSNKDNDNDNDNSSAYRTTIRTTIRDEQLGQLLDFWNLNIHPITPFEAEEIKALYEELGFDSVLAGMQKGHDGGPAKRNMSYIRAAARGVAAGVDYSGNKKDVANLTPEQVQKFRDWLDEKITDWDMSIDEGKAISAVGYSAIKGRKAGTNEEWLQKICAQYAEMFGGKK